MMFPQNANSSLRKAAYHKESGNKKKIAPSRKAVATGRKTLKINLFF
jgi:hypothetical protein